MANNIKLSDRDIDYIARVVQTEVDHRIRRTDPDAYREQVEGVVQTITNRLQSPRYPNTVEAVVNARNQFTKINGPARFNPYGTVSRAPKADSVVTPIVREAVEQIEQGIDTGVGNALSFGVAALSDPGRNRKEVAALPLDIAGIRFGRRDDPQNYVASLLAGDVKPTRRRDAIADLSGLSGRELRGKPRARGDALSAIANLFGRVANTRVVKQAEEASKNPILRTALDLYGRSQVVKRDFAAANRRIQNMAEGFAGGLDAGLRNIFAGDVRGKPGQLSDGRSIEQVMRYRELRRKGIAGVNRTPRRRG